MRYAHPDVVTVTVDYINSVKSVNTQKQSVKFGPQMLKLNFSTKSLLKYKTKH